MKLSWISRKQEPEKSSSPSSFISLPINKVFGIGVDIYLHVWKCCLLTLVPEFQILVSPLQTCFIASVQVPTYICLLELIELCCSSSLCRYRQRYIRYKKKYFFKQKITQHSLTYRQRLFLIRNPNSHL